MIAQQDAPGRQPPRLACLGGCLLLFMPFAFGLLIFVVLLAENDPPAANPPTVHGLLELLAADIQAGDIAVTLHFDAPVSGEASLVLDASTPFDTIQREYFCVQRQSGDTLTRTCIPYDNIANIDYPVGP